jgi:hypothetical protein
MSKSTMEINMNTVKVIVDTVTKVLGTLPAAGIEWTLAEVVVANSFIEQQLFGMTDSSGKVKKPKG